MPTSQERSKVIKQISATSIAVNIILAVFKLLAGVIGHSAAMLSDAVHSFSDVFSTFIVLIGAKVSGKPADEGHPYGHERFESVAAIILAVVLAATGLGIGWSAVNSIRTGAYAESTAPGVVALVAAVVSIALKEAMYWYTIRGAKKINSPALKADAWHHRSDALSSVGALIGIGGARLGYAILDPVASLVICLFVLKAAWDIFDGALDQMTDHAADPETENAMAELVLDTPGVLSLDLLQTRQFGAYLYVDVEIGLDGSLTLDAAHDIAQQVHDDLEDQFPTVKHCMVHMNPAE